MPVRCSHCGADNRDGAKFCRVCGTLLPPPQAATALPQAAPQPSSPQPQVVAPGQLQPVPAQAGQQPHSLIPAMGKLRLFRTGPAVDGRVTVVDPERQEKPPFDPGRALVMLSVVCLLLGAIALSAVFTLAVWIALLIVGIGGLGCLFPMLLGPIYALVAPLINWIRGDRSVLVLNFQVLDGQTGMPVDVVLYRKPGGGNVRLGDMVQVEGRAQHGSNVVRAHKISVYESGGRATQYVIRGARPWPIWVGLLLLGATLALVFYAGRRIGLFH